jgi:photosystem II stability/assembly factor-like uncharacterized protein
VQWTDLNTNLQLTQYIGIALDPTNPDVAYGGSQDNGTSKFTDSLAWTLLRGGDGGFVRVDPSFPNTVYHELVGISLERSDNGGLSWRPSTAGIDSTDPRDFYVPYIMDPVNPQRLLLGTNRVYETTTAAGFWNAISTPGLNGWTITANINSLATAASDGNTVYVSAGGHILVTFDDGANWQLRDVPGVADHFQDIQVDPTDNLTAYAVRDRFGGGHVFRTNDGGQSWTDISGDLPDLPTYTLALDPRTGALFVGNDNGVFFSTDQGNSWSLFGAGLPNAQVRQLELNTDLQILAAGTHGRGLWEILVPGPDGSPVHTRSPWSWNDGIKIISGSPWTVAPAKNLEPTSERLPGALAILADTRQNAGDVWMVRDLDGSKHLAFSSLARHRVLDTFFSSVFPGIDDPQANSLTA